MHVYNASLTMLLCKYYVSLKIVKSFTKTFHYYANNIFKTASVGYAYLFLNRYTDVQLYFSYNLVQHIFRLNVYSTQQ